jgi:hypothetical protein
MKRYLHITFLLVITAIGTEYFARDIFLLLISSIIGLTFILQLNISKKNIQIFIVFLFTQFGVIVSKMFFSPEISSIINLLFLIQLILFSILLIFIFHNVDIKRSFLLVSSFFYLPHLIGLFLGLVNFEAGQFGTLVFGGFHKDPNYLSPDLLFSLLSQLFLLLISNKNMKIISIINLILTIALIILTGSRSAIMTSFVILFLTLPLLKHIVKSKKGLLILVIIFGTFISSNLFLKNDRISYIYDRFTLNEKSASLKENERFGVWDIAFETINNGELLKGFGENNFLKNKYKFVSHNVILNAGIKYGKYTFFSHLLLIIIGFVSYVIKFLRGNYKYGLNIPTFFFILCFSQIFMMNSISVSQKHLYWFILVTILCFGIFRPKFRNNNFI